MIHICCPICLAPRRPLQKWCWTAGSIHFLLILGSCSNKFLDGSMDAEYSIYSAWKLITSIPPLLWQTDETDHSTNRRTRIFIGKLHLRVSRILLLLLLPLLLSVLLFRWDSEAVYASLEVLSVTVHPTSVVLDKEYLSNNSNLSFRPNLTYLMVRHTCGMVNVRGQLRSWPDLYCTDLSWLS